jgi:3,4-dihydroxy 2-butanone 4-phosphate synthase
MSTDTDPTLQFDSIEDTIAAFSEYRRAQFSPLHYFGLRRCKHVETSRGIFSRQTLTTWISTESGEFIIVLDSQDRENEGDLIIAAEAITPAQMAFLVRFTRLEPL